MDEVTRNNLVFLESDRAKLNRILAGALCIAIAILFIAGGLSILFRNDQTGMNFIGLIGPLVGMGLVSPGIMLLASNPRVNINDEFIQLTGLPKKKSNAHIPWTEINRAVILQPRKASSTILLYNDEKILFVLEDRFANFNQLSDQIRQHLEEQGVILSTAASENTKKS
jgi:hypothetical protein